MRNVKCEFDEDTTIVSSKPKGKIKSAILLLALSSNTIHEPAYAHKKISIQQTEGTQMNKRECCEGEGGRCGVF